MALNCIPKLLVRFCNFFLDPTYFFVKRAVISKWLSYWITGGHLYCTKTWSGPVPLLGRLLSLSVNFSDKISSTAVLSVPLLGSWWAKYVGFLVFRIGASYKEKYFLLTRGGAKRFGEVQDRHINFFPCCVLSGSHLGLLSVEVCIN